MDLFIHFSIVYSISAFRNHHRTGRSGYDTNDMVIALFETEIDIAHTMFKPLSGLRWWLNDEQDVRQIFSEILAKNFWHIMNNYSHAGVDAAIFF